MRLRIGRDRIQMRIIESQADCVLVTFLTSLKEHNEMRALYIEAVSSNRADVEREKRLESSTEIMRLSTTYSEIQEHFSPTNLKAVYTCTSIIGPLYDFSPMTTWWMTAKINLKNVGGDKSFQRQQQLAIQ